MKVKVNGEWKSWGSLDDFIPQPFTSARSLFSAVAWNGLTYGPDLDTSQVTDMWGMFGGCSALTGIPLYDTSNVETFGTHGFGIGAPWDGMFRGCSALVDVPAIDTSSASHVAHMFDGCSSLVELPTLDFSSVDINGLNNAVDIFKGCTSLERVVLEGMGRGFSVAGTNMGAAALNDLFSGLATVTDTPTTSINITGTPGAATANKSIATNKGWTVTS